MTPTEADRAMAAGADVLEDVPRQYGRPGPHRRAAGTAG